MADLPTLAEVAAAAGVSPATASRVLTGSVRVKTSTRRQVHDAMSRLGYVRRRAPRGAGRRRAEQTIAAVVCESGPRLFSDPYYARLLVACEEALTAKGLPLMLMTATPATASLTAPRLVAGAVDGVLLIGARARHPLTVTLAASGIPVRCVGRPPDDVTLPFVDADNADGGRQVAEHLLLSGRRSIAVIAGPPTLPAARDRLEGFRRTLFDAGITSVPVAYGDFTRSSGAHAAQWLLQRVPNLDAIFVASDLMAAGAIHTLIRAGRKVPDDVAVIGFGDAPIAKSMSPTLTTVRQPVEEMATLAIKLLLAALTEENGPPADSVL